MMTRNRDVPQGAANGPLVAIEELQAGARFSLRARPEKIAAVSDALGLDLPTSIGECTRSEGSVAACLGPDEWVVSAPEEARERIVADLAKVYPSAPHSLTDISDRERSFSIVGPEAVTLLSIGCPRDLETLKPGQAVRTVFDGVQIVLWRDSADTYRMDVWRSFAPHVHTLLDIGRAEIAAGI